MPSAALMTFGTVIRPYGAPPALNSLANGSTRVSDVIDWSTVRAPMAHIYVRFRVGTSPTASAPLKLYLYPHSEGPANLVPNFPPSTEQTVSGEPIFADLVALGIVASTSNADYLFRGVVSDLPKSFQLGVFNGTGVALNADAAQFDVQIVPVWVEAQ